MSWKLNIRIPAALHHDWEILLNDDFKHDSMSQFVRQHIAQYVEDNKERLIELKEISAQKFKALKGKEFKCSACNHEFDREEQYLTPRTEDYGEGFCVTHNGFKCHLCPSCKKHCVSRFATTS